MSRIEMYITLISNILTKNNLARMHILADS